MNSLKLGLLDFGYREKRSTGHSVLNSIFQYCSLADQLGYSCYWLSEHHNDGLGWSYPEMLLPLLAGQTDKINVGLAGVLIACHSPYLVALNFKLLENLFPGRIDLGIANGSVGREFAELMVSDLTSAQNGMQIFRTRRNELLTYFKNDKELLDKESLIIPPYGGTVPRLWKLSTTFHDLDECIEKKLNICQSLLHAKPKEATDKYKVLEFKEKFHEVHGIYPEIRIAFAGLCDDKFNRSNRPIKLVNPTANYANSPIIGSASFIREKLEEMRELTGVDSFVFYDFSLVHKKRLATLEKLSKEFSLI